MFALSILEYFRYDFVWYAMIATVFIAVCSAFVGITLVLKRLSNIGDGLSHVAFGALSIGLVAGFANNIGGTIFSVIVTGGVSFALITVKNSTKIKGDSLIAMISVFSLAFAYFIINVCKTGGNVAGDVCTTLFGSSSILSIKLSDVIVSGLMHMFLMKIVKSLLLHFNLLMK